MSVVLLQDSVFMKNVKVCNESVTECCYLAVAVQHSICYRISFDNICCLVEVCRRRKYNCSKNCFIMGKECGNISDLSLLNGAF